MSDVTVATANIYWYGLKQAVAQAKNLNVGFFHTNADDLRLATLLSRIGADLFCFQEIVDVVRLEGVLASANSALRLRDGNDQVVSSSPVSAAPDTKQRVVLAWNTEQLSLLNWQRLSMWTRAPVVAEFHHKPTGQRFRIVGAHAKSSAPEANDQAGQIKRKELALLAQWVTQETQAGNVGKALILGDFNSMHGGEDAGHLQQGPLSTWHWREATGVEGSRWTTTTDLVVIDHVLVSPGLADRVKVWPEIVYFDHDPEVPDAAAQQPAIPGILKSLTDHRPVRMKLDLGN